MSDKKKPDIRMPQRRGPMNHVGTGEKSLNFGPSLKRLFSHLKPEWVSIFFVVVMTAVATLLNAIGPIILGEATNIVFNAVVINEVAIDFSSVGRVLLLALIVYLTFFGLSWLSGYIVNKAVQRSVYRMRRQVSDKLFRLPLARFDKLPRGELLSRVTNDIDNVAQTLQQTLSQIVNNLFTVAAVVSMMFIVSWQLALIALLTVPVAMVVTLQIAKRAQPLFMATWKNTGELNSQVEEAYSGHEIITVFGRRKETLENFKEKNNELYKASFGSQFISSIIMPAMFFVGNLNYVAIAVFGGIMVASGNLAIGSVQAFIQYSRMFTHPITSLASMANLLQSGVASAERVFEVLDFEEKPKDKSGSFAHNVTGEVEFENVSFSYDTEKPLIADLSLKIAAGNTVAIVGPTGAGKTTLVNLLLRFYDVDSGRILLDGTEITEVPRRELRKKIGMVLQDSWLFGGTIKENIAYGLENASDEQIIAAAKASYVDRFVKSLPDGYDTIINDEASNLSSGEKQLITIARAFISNPELLILDEATSSVDTRTEVLVQKAMSKLKQNRTSFVIAHRLSTIRDADIILVMVAGNIVEHGSHQELLKMGGTYAGLHNAQLTGMTKLD